MNIKKLWETYFFKKRNIMVYHNNIQPFKNIFFISMVDFDVELLLNRADSNLAKYLKMRKDNPAWVLFYCEVDSKILGYSFLHVPVQEEWNDSLPTKSGEARVSTNFVYPEYRGRGILGEIAKCQINYANENNLKLWCVIESSNISAMRASYKNTLIDKSNYLVKILKRNIVSITTKPFRASILLRKKRAKR